MGGIRVPREQHGGRGARVVVPRPDLLLVHRRAQHRDGRIRAHLSGGRAVQRSGRVQGAGEAGRGQAVSGGVNRLPSPAGSLVDRTRTVTFTFEGRRFGGFAGDTIASALAANDEWLLSRSFKYHRPRGILTMAGQDSNTLVQ